MMLCALAWPWEFDVERHYTLSYCVAGPEVGLVVVGLDDCDRDRWCKVFDIDRDGDVDLRDVAAVYAMPTWRWIRVRDLRPLFISAPSEWRYLGAR